MILEETKKDIVFSEGPSDAPIVVVSGVPSWEGKAFSEPCRTLLLDTARRAGINSNSIRFDLVLGEIPTGRKESNLGYERRAHWIADARSRLSRLTPTIFVPVGNLALETLTNHTSIDKWQLSIIESSALTSNSRVKTIPLLHPERVFANYAESPFLIFGWGRIREELSSPAIRRVPRVFYTSPTFNEAVRFLGRCLISDALSVDIETAHGQITCVGFAISPTEAMCIPTLPENWADTGQFHIIWDWIKDVLKGPSKKIFQNWVYDTTYFSKYGIPVHNLWHDTMHAQKFLHPELPAGLDTIARLYTREPYWKDEGKDWKSVNDLNQFWVYNCKDTTVTFEAALAQRKDLDERKLTRAFEELVMSMARPASEMCWRGLPVDLEKRNALIESTTGEIKTLEAELNELARPLLGKELNPRSPIQVKEFFKRKGYRIPLKQGKETTDATALMKLKLRYPHDKSLELLLALSEKNKFYSSYLKVLPYADNRYRFSLNINGTDTGRWSSSKDPWDNGFNAQTVNSQFKKILRAPLGWIWLECDLKQADARFVAWDSGEPTLMKFFNEGVDIHRFVASRPELFNKLETEITHDERQLGKKVGHASNYGMRGARLSEICLLEMGINLSSSRADQMLEGYHRVFPGIRMWQQRIAAEIRRSKRLTTPMGRERYFYDRLGDDLFRVAYAYRPQSTVADVVNCLIKHVDKNRNPEKVHFALQAHDAAVMLVEESHAMEVLALIKDENSWNPRMTLTGGVLQIPIEVKAGEILGEAKKIYG